MVAGSKRVRGRKNRKKARNHAVRNAVTDTHASRRRCWLTLLSSGPTAATPAEAAAFEVPTAPEPTQRVAALPFAGGVLATSGLSAMILLLLQSVCSVGGHGKRRQISHPMLCSWICFAERCPNHPRQRVDKRSEERRVGKERRYRW